MVKVRKISTDGQRKLNRIESQNFMSLSDVQNSTGFDKQQCIYWMHRLPLKPDIVANTGGDRVIRLWSPGRVKLWHKEIKKISKRVS